MPELPTIVVWGLKATPLLLGAWVFTALLRRTGTAATRHLIWLVAVAATLGLPLAGTVAPQWELAVLPPVAPAATSPITEPTPQPAPEPAATPAARVTPEPVPIMPEAGTAVGDPLGPILPSAATVWAAGVALVLFTLLLSLGRTALLMRAAPIARDGPVTKDVEAIVRELGIRRPVRARIGHPDAMPMTWGAFRPTVLLPATFAAWPSERRRAVLLHELGHVRRFDWVSQLAAQVACAVYWWHPLVWLAARALRRERELACDDLVLSHGTTPSAYANDLLEIARTFRARPASALGAVAMARRSQLAGRLLAVLDGARARGTVGPRHAVPVVGIGLAAVLPLAGLAAGRSAAVLPTEFSPATAAAVATPRAGFAPVEGRTIVPPIRQQARGATLCDWSTRGTDNNSSSMTVDDDRMRIRITRDDCTLEVRARGDVRYADTDRDVARLAAGGSFTIEEQLGRARRRVELTESGGTLERRWFVDGSEQTYGDAARAWLGDALLVLFRRAALNADARALRILDERGVDGLIAEIALMQTDWGASRYYGVLFERASLTPRQQITLLEDAGRRISSDHALGQVLKGLARRGALEPAVQRAYIAATATIASDFARGQALTALLEGSTLEAGALDALLRSAAEMSSDHQRSVLLLAVADRYPSDRPLPASYLDAVNDMSSDHARGQVLSALLERDPLSAADRARVLDAVARMGSDHQQAEILLMVARTGLDTQTRDPFFTAANGLGSNFERQRVLIAAAGGDGGTPPPDEATLLAIIASARDISSNHSKAEVLIVVAGRGLSSAALRSAYSDAAASISSRFDRQRVLEAAGMQGI